MAIPWRERARLRPAELAEVAGVCRRTIFREIARGRIAVQREGRCTFIPIGAALEYVGERNPDALPELFSAPISERALRDVERARAARSKGGR